MLTKTVVIDKKFQGLLIRLNPSSEGQQSMKRNCRNVLKLKTKVGNILSTGWKIMDPQGCAK